MLIHLARMGDERVDEPVAAFNIHGVNDRVGEHRLTEDPEAADVVIFTQRHMLPAREWRGRPILEHPLAQRFPEKAMVYDESDRPWGILPGVYVNLPTRWFRPERHRAWSYFVPRREPVRDPDLLFSFVGSATDPCREPLFGLRHPDAVVERVSGFRFWDSGSEGFHARREHFADVLRRSRFVLCPRGWGTSSVRLVETIAVGAVPVIIADDWVPPRGPDWESFSLRWPEDRVNGLIELMEERLPEWERMGAAARETYERFFSPEIWLHGVASALAEIRQEPGFTPGPSRDGLYRRRALERGVSLARYGARRASRRSS